MGPGSGGGWVYEAGSGCSDGRLRTEVIGVWVGLACLHSNLESGFKKTKQEKMPPPRVSQATETFPGSFLVTKRPISGGWQAGQEGSRSGLQSASLVAANAVLRLLPDFWAMLDRGPFVPIERSRSPSPFPLSYRPTLW